MCLPSSANNSANFFTQSPFQNTLMPLHLSLWEIILIIVKWLKL